MKTRTRRYEYEYGFEQDVVTEHPSGGHDPKQIRTDRYEKLNNTEALNMRARLAIPG